jgi:hypothetical protein
VRRLTIVSTLFHAACIAGCVATGSPKVASTSRATDQAEINRLIVQAFQEGRYADALRLERQSDVPQPERDLALGQTILQGLADPQAAQRPGESIDEGIGLLERSALQGHQQAVSGLAALFYTGLPGDGKSTALVPPNARLNACWERVKIEPSVAPTCVSLRRTIQDESR